MRSAEGASWRDRFASQPRASGTTPTATEPTKMSATSNHHSVQECLRFLGAHAAQSRIERDGSLEGQTATLAAAHAWPRYRLRLRQRAIAVRLRVQPAIDAHLVYQAGQHCLYRAPWRANRVSGQFLRSTLGHRVPYSRVQSALRWQPFQQN